MARAATAFVEFEGDFSKIQSATKTQAKGLEKSFGASFKSIAKGAAISFAAVGGAALIKGAFKQAEQSAKVARQTEAVIKSTGGAAQVSAGHVEKLANKLSGVAAIDDEIIASAENVLLTFTNIRNVAGKGGDIFDQATTSAVDLSAALGQDLQSSVIQIGKALNDPIKGITALRRVGVSFTKDQIKQVKALVETGKTLDAQKLILRELNTEFGGAAAAAATPTEKLKVAFGNLQESLGKVLVPLVEKFVPVMTFLATHPEAAAAIFALAAAFGAMIVVTKIIEAVKAFRTVMIGLNVVLAANPIVLITAGIIALGVAVFIAYKKFKPFRDAVDKAWQILQDLFHWVQKNWPLLLAILTGPFGLAVRFIIQHLDQIKAVVEGVRRFIVDKFNSIIRFFASIPAKIGRGASTMFDFIKTAFRSAINFVIRGWNSLEFKIPGFDPPGPGPKFGGFTLGLPHISELHSGGIFTAAGGEGLALLKSGEGVFTQDQMAALGNGRGIDARTIVQGNVYGDAHLHRIFDDHDQRLALMLRAG